MAQQADTLTVEDIEVITVCENVLLAERSEDDSMFDVELETTTETSLFMVPRVLNLTINAKIDTLLFGNGILTNLHGEAEIRDEYLLLDHFNVTNGAGEMRISLAYRANSLQEATAWMDIKIEKTDVQNLLQLYPLIDSVMPLTRSFQGLIDCRLTASTILDSAMNVDLDRTMATVNLHGENLVLIETETLGAFVQRLMFRRKDENIIDSLSVDLVVKDGHIEVFPFRLVMGRWTVAVGGTQDLDMNLNYHITVLQSPWFVPFKLGIDVSGPAEKFKWRLKSPKYRRMDSPVISMELRDRTINVQGEVRRLLDYQFSQIVGQTEN
jgi:hypothetical protein